MSTISQGRLKEYSLGATWYRNVPQNYFSRVFLPTCLWCCFPDFDWLNQTVVENLVYVNHLWTTHCPERIFPGSHPMSSFSGLESSRWRSQRSSIHTVAHSQEQWGDWYESWIRFLSWDGEISESLTSTRGLLLTSEQYGVTINENRFFRRLVRSSILSLGILSVLINSPSSHDCLTRRTASSAGLCELEMCFSHGFVLIQTFRQSCAVSCPTVLTRTKPEIECHSYSMHSTTVIMVFITTAPSLIILSWKRTWGV